MSGIRKSFHISIISLCLICPTLANTSYDFIEVGTFNIAELFEGNNPAARDEPVITRMVVSLDPDQRIAPAILELAETRAIARSLRFAGYGVEYCSAEEVSHLLRRFSLQR